VGSSVAKVELQLLLHTPNTNGVSAYLLDFGPSYRRNYFLTSLTVIFRGLMNAWYSGGSFW
jgi:hypothetical protein